MTNWGPSEHLRPLFAILTAAFPSGVSGVDYRALIRVLADDMSERNLADVVSALTGIDRHVVANDAADIAAHRPPEPADVDRIRRILISAGWTPEVEP